MSKTRIHALAATAITALALTVTGCSPSYPQGPPGHVAHKDTDLACTVLGKRHQCANHYFLTVRTTGGTQDRFRVTSADYAHCLRGSTYPRCTEK